MLGMHKIIHTNTFVLICITFTVATLFDLIFSVAITGDFYGTDYLHIGTRFILCTFVSVSLLVFRYFKRLPHIAVIGIHFLVVIIFTVLYVWITSFFIEQHPRAMFYMVRSVLIVYPIIATGFLLYRFIQRNQ